jgi:hypothetical protein
MSAPSTTTRPSAPAPVFGRPQTLAPTRPVIDFRSRIKKGPQTTPPSLFIYGVEKIGKSTAGADTDSPLFMCAENGLKGDAFAEVAHDSPQTWQEVLALLDWLIVEAHEYKTLVVDTLDWLEALLYAYICLRDNKAGIEAYNFSKGQKEVAPEEFKQLLSRCDKLLRKGIAVVFLSHSMVKAFSNPTGDNFDRYQPKGNPWITGLVKEWCDVVLFAHYLEWTDKDSAKAKAKATGGKIRVVETERDAAWDAGNRFGLPPQMELDMSQILSAIAAGNGSLLDSGELRAEIDALVPLLSEKGQTRVALDLESAGTNAATLSKILNTIRATVARIQEAQQPTITEEN